MLIRFCMVSLTKKITEMPSPTGIFLSENALSRCIGLIFMKSIVPFASLDFPHEKFHVVLIRKNVELQRMDV